MPEVPPEPQSPLPALPIDSDGAAPRPRLSRLFVGLAVAQLLLIALSPLLARLIWLPFYFGLFFFLVGGLLVGAATFRIARPARPIGRRPLVIGALAIGLITYLITTVFEFRHFASTVADPPKFARARNAVVQNGGSLNDLEARAADAFAAKLAQDYAPLTPLAYARWTIREGKMRLTVDDQTESIATEHAGWKWLLRSLGEILLVAAGLWSSLEALRSPTPITNLIGPNEEYEEDD